MLLDFPSILFKIIVFSIHLLGKYSASSIVPVLLSAPSGAVPWRPLQLRELLVVWLPQRRVVHPPEQAVVNKLKMLND